MILETGNEPSHVLTRQQCDALAERIAAALLERKKVGDERRRQERKYGLLNNDRALARYYRLRAEFPERTNRRVKEIDRIYDVIMSSNAAALLRESPEVALSQNPGSS
jgi:hypothetical protein